MKAVAQVPAEMVIDLWHDVSDAVADGRIDNTTIHSALEHAIKYYATSEEGRNFIDNNLTAITQILLSQSPLNLSMNKDELGHSDNDYIEKSLQLLLQFINDDLRTNALKPATKSKITLDVLKVILDYRNVYYIETPPEIGMNKVLLEFRRMKGFYNLAIYFHARAKTESFPEWEVVHRGLWACYECLVFKRLEGGDEFVKFRKEASNLTASVMNHLSCMKNDAFKDRDVQKISVVVKDIKQLHMELALADPQAPLTHFNFCKSLIERLLSAESQKYKQYGQATLHELIQSVHSFRPTAESFDVQGASDNIVNGMYSISADTCDSEGYIIPGVSVSYEKVDKTTGQKFKLFLDLTFNEGGAMWCISEEHCEARDPGYTDYYTAVPDGPLISPPFHGWELSGGGDGSSLTLKPLPRMIPTRDEHNTIQKDLSRWLLEKKILDLVVGADIGIVCGESTILTLMESLDGYMKDENYMPAKIASMFVSILPSIQYKTMSESSAGIRESLNAAVQRLASAERWEQATSRTLENARLELKAASTEVEDAQAYLEQIEQQYYQNGAFQNGKLHP